MQVHLAGFNVDTQVLKELQQAAGSRQDITPEVISAAYARISRDPRAISEIREDARRQVEKARRSNSTIIFKMGHHSVAEHAVFNFDILEVSRLVMEEVEKFRLSSYTEKSQRYITLDKGFIVPQEIKGSHLEELFVEMVKRQNEAYVKLFEKLKTYVFKKHNKLATDPKNHNLLEGWAKEDARYITALATHSQVGLTINARNLELLLRRFASSGLAEVKSLGEAIYHQVHPIAPSIVIFHQANDRDLKTYPQLKELASIIFKKVRPVKLHRKIKEVALVEFTKDADNIIAASLLHSSCSISYGQCLAAVKKLTQEEKLNIFKTAWRNMQLYDSMLREFEYVSLNFNIVLSAACFGQLKRHRMSTITAQNYDPNLGLTIPEAIREIGMQKYFKEIVEKTNEVYNVIFKEKPLAAPYVLTNAHRRRILVHLNARELYHISRLRQDAHAQWDIQNISKLMVAEAEKVMPLTFGLAGAKDKYNEIYKNIFGELPKVTTAELPGARKIK
jgi:flavin-dependent thymidylate synthase